MSENTEPVGESGAWVVSVSEFRTNCATLLAAVRDTGEEIVVTRHGHPLARVAPLRRQRTGTFAGMATDLINLPADFDIDEMELLDPDWYEQWSAKWDRRLDAAADRLEQQTPDVIPAPRPTEQSSTGMAPLHCIDARP